MPKPKPDKIIRHEIVLGRADRELLETATTAYTVNRVATPLTNVLSSTTGLLLVSTVLLAHLSKYLPEGWPEMDDNQLRDWFEAENIILGTGGFGLGALIGGLLGGPLGAGLGGAAGAGLGTVAQEFAEEAQEAGVPRLMSYSMWGQIVGGARLCKELIDELQGE